ncbi:hypothetical protein ACFQFQ_21905 [Sulfitobacter porphyrae]|uniref:Uncharacterized protein n=1 Tax=Sulfitobacter porphyrae TaxID=1246864 RepID=A0ABW2B8G7_9RHOB
MDRTGQKLDLMLSEYRDEAAAPLLLVGTVQSNGLHKACPIARAARIQQR